MPNQEEAIKKIKGPCIILAGAGTGKTYTIIEKIKYLIKNRIFSPEKIVCITFSNEAANNLMSRIQKALNFEQGKEPVIKTFHSFSAELLRAYGEKIGINKDFNILTPDEAKVVLYKYLKVPAGNCHQYVNAIGTAKDLGISIEIVKDYLSVGLKDFDSIDLEKRLENLQFELHTLYLNKNKFRKKEISAEVKEVSSLHKLKKFVSIWAAYEKIKALKNYQDYSDLNKNALRLLQENKDVAESYDYIIIDEFQDTNKIQLDLLVLLAQKKDITVVGDLNQSIYRFRGAYNKNFNEFKDKFNVLSSDIFNLDKSYRSSNKILKAAHRLILNNYSIPSECFEVMNFENRQGDNIEIYELKNAREEARRIVEIIEQTVAKGIEARDICVMFRTHQQGRIIRRALDVKKVPYISVTKSSLLKEKSIKTVINYLTILDKLKSKQNGGEQAWWDLIYHLNLEEEDLIRFGKYIKDNRKSYNLSALILSSVSELKFSEKGHMAVKILLKRINMMLEYVNKEIKELIMDIYNISGLINSNKTKEEKIITMNLNKFYELAKNHSVIHSNDLNGFIYYLDILNSLGIDMESADSEDDGVRLMTLHATKGLEYNTVIITNLCQKRFPIERISNSLIPLELSPEFSSKKSVDDYSLYEYERQNQLFEERRLCYVAFTRAKEKLILTYAQEYGGKKYYPSQFLHEINYKQNTDLTFSLDLNEKYSEVNSEIKDINFSDALSNRDFNSIITNIVKSDKSEVKQDLVLSPSSLLAFVDCQKKYEYKYVYNMPEQKTVSWEAIMLGSFVHLVLEVGVKSNLKEFRAFEDIARNLHLEKEWEGINIDEALVLIKVFFERNKKKYSVNSKTEQKLNAEIGGIKFIGFADRIDYSNDGLEIIDYKTGKSSVPPLERSWQLGYYAIAASKLGKVKRITLDMLRHEMPLEFELDDKGNAVPVNSSKLDGFNIYNVEQQLIKIAHEIISAYKNGFKPCAVEDNCEFCNEYVWGF